MKRTNTKFSTWKGRQGSTFDLLAAASRPLGYRVNVHRWTDTNDVEVRAICGDGRNVDEFREYSREQLKDPTPEQLAEAEQRALVALAEARAGKRQPLTMKQVSDAACAPPTNAPKKYWHADGCPGGAGCTCGGGLTDAELFAKANEHLPHAHITGPCVVVIYGEDMAERVVGPFPNGVDADLYICNKHDIPIGRPDYDLETRPRVDEWADVFPLEEPRK